jgi:hypothetical protein
MGLVLNKLLLAYKNDKVDGRDLLEYLVMKCEPSLENLYNTIVNIAKKHGFATPEVMQQNQKKYIEDRSKEGVIQKDGGVLYQFGLGSMKKGSYDRYTPFDLNPDADFLVTGLGAPVGLVQASCNPYKSDRELKGVDLGKIKDEVLLSFKPELEQVILPYKIIKKVSEKKATKDSVGFTQKDMDAIYGSMPSFNPKTNTISAYDYLVANAGGHKCITTISGIGFVYSGYDKPYVKDLPEEAIPIAFYEGSNSFIQDIKQKLLRFRKLSEKQIQSAISGMKREGIDVELLANPKQGRGTTELTKDIRDKFVEILNNKIQNQTESLSEGHNKLAVSELLKNHVKGEKVLSENDWRYVMTKLNGISDNRGQWDHPGKCTMIESNRITMKNVKYPLVGIDNTGHIMLMLPENDYKFPGKMVFEIPLKGKYKDLGIELLKNSSFY